MGIKSRKKCKGQSLSNLYVLFTEHIYLPLNQHQNCYVNLETLTKIASLPQIGGSHFGNQMHNKWTGVAQYISLLGLP